jgi:hypothetical protein
LERPRLSLPLLIFWLALVMITAGFLMHGIGPEVFERSWNNLLARPSQSLAFRFVLQPLISTIIAIRDGIKDSRNGRSPYFWTIVFDRAQRGTNVREGIAATGKIFLISIAIDIAYQGLELHAFYPGEALLVAVLLAFIPYLIVRGLATRFARRWLRYRAEKPQRDD